MLGSDSTIACSSLALRLSRGIAVLSLPELRSESRDRLRGHLLFLQLSGLPIAALLTFGHPDLLLLRDNAALKR